MVHTVFKDVKNLLNNVILKSHVKTIVLISLHSSLLLQKTYCQEVQCHRSLQKNTQKKRK